jgi:AP-1 complex subunit gamma-1
VAMRICLIVDKHSPSRRWNFDTILKVLIVTGQSVKESSIVSLIHLITSTPQLQTYAMIKIFFAATSHI